MILRLIKLWRLGLQAKRLALEVQRLQQWHLDMRLHGAHPETLKRCTKRIEAVRYELHRTTAEYSLLKSNKDEKY